MISLALFEGRKVARNPLLWIGAALLLALAVLNAKDYWPSLDEDAEHAYWSVVVLAPFALLVGAWVGLRDRTSGAEAVVASTPLSGRGLLAPGRMAGVGLVAWVSCTAAFAATGLFSFVRGGHGFPDPFLVADAGLYVALAACGGFAIGHSSGSRIVSLLAAPILPGIVFWLQGTQSGGVTEPSWLLPNPPLPGRFGPLGYLPAIFPMHAAYLAGTVIALIGIVWIVTGRRESSAAARAGFVVSSLGAAVVLASGAWLVGQPKLVHVFGSDRSDWVEIHMPADWARVRAVAKNASGFSYAAVGRTCAEVDDVTACVFPEYGTRLAIAIATDAAPLAELASLEGVPQTIRMVPTAEHTDVSRRCSKDGEMLVGSRRWSTEFAEYESVAEAAFYCAVYGPRQIVNPAADALHAWFSVRVGEGLTGDAYVESVRQGWGRRAAETVGHLGDVPVADVVAMLEPVWDEVRAREVTLAELREALRA